MGFHLNGQPSGIVGYLDGGGQITWKRWGWHSICRYDDNSLRPLVHTVHAASQHVTESVHGVGWGVVQHWRSSGVDMLSTWASLDFCLDHHLTLLWLLSHSLLWFCLGPCRCVLGACGKFVKVCILCFWCLWVYIGLKGLPKWFQSSLSGSKWFRCTESDPYYAL